MLRRCPARRAHGGVSPGPERLQSAESTARPSEVPAEAKSEKVTLPGRAVFETYLRRSVARPATGQTLK